MKTFICCILITTCMLSFAAPHVSVTYPHVDQRISARDKTYIMGQIEPVGAKLFINNFPVVVHPTGSFLAVLPVVKGAFSFRCKVVFNNKILTEYDHKVTIVHWAPSKPITTDSIDLGSLLPAQNIGVLPGENIFFRCKTKTGKKVLCTITDAEQTVSFQLFEKKTNGVYESKKSFSTSFNQARISYKVLDSVKIPVAQSKAHLTVRNTEEYSSYIVTADTMEVKARDAASYNGDYSSFLTSGAVLQGSGFNGEWIRLQQTSDTAVYVKSAQLSKVVTTNLMDSAHISDIIITEKSTSIVAYIRGLKTVNSSWLPTPNSKKIGIRFFKTTVNPQGETLYTRNSRVSEVVKTPGIDYSDIVFKLDFEPLWGFDISYENGYGILTIKKPLTERLSGDITICLDAGHGGDEPGAIGPSGLQEKTAVLDMTLSLEKALINAGYKVILTRDSDQKIPIYDRPAFAKRNKADIFLSIHYNACPDGTDPFKRRGLESYYYYNSGKLLAQQIHTQLRHAVPIKDNGVEYKSLVVCRNFSMPSCLLELDYISIPDAEVMIMTSAYQKKMAAAIVVGVNNYLRKN